MNFNDILLAVEDMLKCHGAKKDDVVYIRQEDGSYKVVDGFEVNEDGLFIVY